AGADHPRAAAVCDACGQRTCLDVRACARRAAEVSAGAAARSRVGAAHSPPSRSRRADQRADGHPRRRGLTRRDAKGERRVRPLARRVLAIADEDDPRAMKRRVLIISTYYHPVIGGVEIHARQLVQHLHARGFSVEVVTKRTSLEHPATETVDEVVVHRIGPIGERRASGKWVILPTLFATLLRLGSRFDVLVCVDYRGIGIAAIAAAAVLRKPVIAQGEVAGVLAGAVDGSNSGVPPESDTTKILKAPARLIYKRADAVACIGRDLETEAIRAGVAKARVHYLPHGVDMERFRPAQPGERDDVRRQ